MTTFEREWDDDDLDAALDWMAAQELRCGGCGGYLDETTDPDRFNAYDAEPVACHRCAATDRAAKKFRAGNGDTSGVMYRSWEREPMSDG